MSRRVVLGWVLALVVAGVGAGVMLGVWRPWDTVPDALRDAVGPIESVPGVVSAEVGYDVLHHDAKDGDTAVARLEVRLEEDLTPQAAGDAAGQVSALFTAAPVPGVDLTWSISIVAGTPDESGSVATYPLSVHTLGSTDLDTGVTKAYELWQAGAARASAHSAETSTPDELLALADFAERRGFVAGLATLDGTVRYEPGIPVVVDVALVRLAVEAAEQDRVESAFSTGQRGLSVYLADDTASTTAALVDWLRARTVAGDEPVPYTLLSPGYDTLAEGWVGGFAPPEPEPHPVRMPEGTEAWPTDDAAAECTGADLELSLGTPDAATGARYLAVHARNVSGEPCAVDGFPHVVFRDADGRAQRDVTIVPHSPGLVAERVVVPAGEQVLATLAWRAMSTTNDPEVTTEVEIVAVPGADPVALVPRAPDLAGPSDGEPVTLDVLDGAEVRQGPWAQAVDGWSW
ncbi:hypothetical protein GCM10009718_35110 [Isoptericola halotolerans]|uniref:DUF4232 domain-containing protein n=1 Tax=Isoptericola halotolerans TaxID=300560 RepID=A0ABX2A6C2_9MICO|nr:DUF4232 domain-containing protein [Isoptericola halotolerans]NOV97156.1 hypothetical protein [Isoptericola halotolerans]